MSKKVLLIAAALLATGSIAAISAPHFRGGHMRHGAMQSEAFGLMGLGFGRGGVRLGERLKELDVDKDGAVTVEEFLSRRETSFGRYDRNKDGVIDASDFDAVAKENADYWMKRFLKRFDADKDGRIGKEEFTKARKERLAMRDLDDGQMTGDDMGPGMRERVRRWWEDRAQRNQSGHDGQAAKDGQAVKDGQDGKDGRDGKRRGFTLERLLGRADREFSHLDKNGDGFIDARDLHALASERIALASTRFFRRFDADHDGKVTKDEFSRSARERFADLDLDGDGKITDADLPPMMRGRGFLQ